MFTARIIDGIDAERIGLVNHVVKQNDSGDAAYQRAVELAQEIAPQVNARTSCSILKQLCHCHAKTEKAFHHFKLT